MYSYMIDIYGLPLDRTNVNGGAIALGHPLGCSESLSFFLSWAKKRKAYRSAIKPCVLRGISHTDAEIVTRSQLAHGKSPPVCTRSAAAAARSSSPRCASVSVRTSVLSSLPAITSTSY